MEQKTNYTQDIINKLTKEQVDYISKELDKLVEESPSLKAIKNLPSNNGTEVSDSTEKGEWKKVMVSIDPNSGENRIAGTVDNDEFEQRWNDMIISINNNSAFGNEEKFTKEEVSTVAEENNLSLSDESIDQFTNILNRYLNRELFNFYKSFPKEICDIIDKYVFGGPLNLNLSINQNAKRMVETTSIEMANYFIKEIKLKRTANDFIYNFSSYCEYNEACNIENVLEKVESEKYKEILCHIIDIIDDAKNLNSLMEFSKNCKIKKIEIEMPYKRDYADFLNKYRNSDNNIYDIALAHKALSRALKSDYKASLFLICFCHQVKKFKPNSIYEHAYMYYVIYNCVMLDSPSINNTSCLNTAIDFIDRAKIVVSNLEKRNNFK